MRKVVIALSCILGTTLSSCSTDSIDEKSLSNDELTTTIPISPPIINSDHGDRDKDKSKG